MKRMRKRLIHALMALAVISAWLPLYPIESSAAGMTMKQCQDKYHNLTPPPGFPLCVEAADTRQIKPFNQQLFDDQGVVAYGDPASVNLAANDFKPQWLDADGTLYPNTVVKTVGTPPAKHPYFTKNGVAGEYRYYGYDRNGNKYANFYFPRDADSGTPPALKKWIYRPWESNLTAGNKYKPDRYSPLLGDILLDNIHDSPELLAVVDKIIKNDHFNGGIIEAGNKNRLPMDPIPDPRERHLFDYMYVQQDPTVWAEGMGIMFHERSDDHSVWYQNFSLPKLEGKELPGMKETTIQPESNYNMETNLAHLPDSVTWTFDFLSIIHDDRILPGDSKPIYQDRFRKAQYYTREDVRYWEFTITYHLAGSKSEKKVRTDQGGQVVIANDRQVGKFRDTFTFSTSQLKQGDQLMIELKAKAHYGLTDNVFDAGNDTYTITFRNDAPPTPAPLAEQPPKQMELPDPLSCYPSIPADAFDILPFPASDGTNMTLVQSRTVYIDGVRVDDELFFSGQYVFGDDADGLHQITVQWVPYPQTGPNVPEDWEDPGCQSVRWVHVHDTKPRAQFQMDGSSGLWKENRTFTIDDTSALAIDPFVQAAYPLTGWSWSWSAVNGSSDADRRMGVDAPQHKEFLYKKPGEYQVTLTVTNVLGRISDPYVLTFTVLPDTPPAVIFHPYSSQISREDALFLFYDAVSIDDDIITTQSFEVYYDADGDESYSQLIDTFEGAVSQYKPAINKLGKYRIKVTVEEQFGQATMPAFITPADKRITVRQFEFEVDNYIPYNDIFTDIPAVRPLVDVFFMADKNLAQAKIDYLKGNGVTINNNLRAKGLDPTVEVWDMHTYTYSTPGSTSRNTGESRPPSSITYCNGNGYCGTLSKISETDNGEYKDYGKDKEKEMSDSKTATDSCSNTQYVSYDSEGTGSVSFSRPGGCPSSMSYNSGGYTGTLYRGSTEPSSGCSSTGTPNTSCSTTYTTYYSGTVTKTWTETYHVYDWQWESDYTAYYSGTLYKDIRQPFTNPFSRTVSDKFVVYISDTIINELADFNMVKGISDAHIVLVGNSSIRSQDPSAAYIANTGQPIEQLVQLVVDHIAGLKPPSASQTVLVNESFQLLTEEADPENDPIVTRETMYIHDEHYFDNPMGHASFALKKGDAPAWTNESLRTSFSLPGEYRILRRVKDQPSPDPQFAKYGYYSNEAETTVIVHRKPIAEATLDWTYDGNCSCYQTTWVDNSYDLDHNVSDPANRGIVERKIRYQFGGEWYYKIPSELKPGSYHLEYVVKDVEGAWSDPFIMNFTLAATVPPQLQAGLKPQDAAFTLAGGVPASEGLVAYDLWTRFPSSLSLQFLMNQSGNYINRTVPYYTGTMNGQNIYWADVVTPIPATTPDGTYTYRVQANGNNGATAHKDFSVTVLTPINLVPRIDSDGGTNVSEIVTKLPVILRATTTEYPSQTTVTAFKGTAYQTTINLSGTVTATSGVGSKNWSATYTVPAIPDGNYTFEWISTNPSGKREVATKTVKVVNNRPPIAGFDWTPKPVYEGDNIVLVNTSTDPDDDPLVSVWAVTGPGGYAQSGNTKNLTIPGSGTENLPGTYHVTLTVRDPSGATSTATGNIVVHALGITGMVGHTEDWDKHRQGYNERHPSAPRPDDWFWAGEVFVLSAQVTDTGASATKPLAVEVSAPHGLFKALEAEDASRIAWQAWLRSRDAGFSFSELPQGPLTFTFTVRYSNGVEKTDQVTVQLVNTIHSYIRVHRVQ